MQGIIFSLNSEVCSTHGFSPFFVFFLRHPHTPLSLFGTNRGASSPDSFVSQKLRLLSDTFQRARQRQTTRAGRYKQQYDRRHGVKEKVFRPGDQIWCRNFNARSKLDNPWIGPFVVVSCVGRRHVEYMDQRGMMRRTHVQNVKSVIERSV